MTTETTRMSSKGQIVIPADLRIEMGLESGSVFAVSGTRDVIILKKVSIPDKKELIAELKKHAVEGKERLQSKGISEKDIPEILHKSRRNTY